MDPGMPMLVPLGITPVLAQKINSGGYLGVIDLLESNQCIVSKGAKALLRRITIEVRSGDMTLLFMPVQLFEIEKPTHVHICSSLKEKGFRMCPPWLPIVLRLFYKVQPEGECLNFAMDPIAYDDATAFFTISNEQGQLILDRRVVFPDQVFGENESFVFMDRIKNKRSYTNV